MGSPFLNQVNADERSRASHLFTQVRFTESPSFIVSLPFVFEIKTFRSRRESTAKFSNFSGYTYSLYINDIKNLPTTFNTGPTSPRSILKLLSVMMYFPASLCITRCILKEQLWCLSPIYWNLLLTFLTLLSKMTRPLRWRGFTWPHITRFTLRLSGW